MRCYALSLRRFDFLVCTEGTHNRQDKRKGNAGPTVDSAARNPPELAHAKIGSYPRAGWLTIDFTITDDGSMSGTPVLYKINRLE